MIFAHPSIALLRKLLMGIMLASLAGFSLPLAAQSSETVQAELNALQFQDIRLAMIAERMQIANARLCRDLMPITGMVLHSQDQYNSQSALDWSADGPLALMGVVSGSAADIAGLKAGDTLVQMGDIEITALTPKTGMSLKERASEALSQIETGGPLGVIIQRDETQIPFELTPPAGCRSMVEIIITPGGISRSDGRVIQISYDRAVSLDGNALAVIFAHELAHSVLLHRERLTAAGVKKGFLGELGRNQKLNRQVEIEADRLSVHLLANAGYDPQIAVYFWQSALGDRLNGGMWHSVNYPSAEGRSVILVTEIERYIPYNEGLTWPGHLLFYRDRAPETH